MSDVRWTARLEQVDGNSAAAVITAELPLGWHINPTFPQAGAQPTLIAAPPGSAYTLAGAVSEPSPTSDFDAAMGMQTAFHEGIVEFRCPVEVVNPSAARELLVTYQACTAQTCLVPRTVVIPVGD